jgi:hypothetical protein
VWQEASEIYLLWEQHFIALEWCNTLIYITEQYTTNIKESALKIEGGV